MRRLRLIVPAVLIHVVLLIGCYSYRHAVKYDGYRVEPKPIASVSEKVTMNVTRAAGPNSQLRLTVTNGKSEPILVNRKYCNIAHGDTVVNLAPLYELALTEYTYASTRSMNSNEEVGASVAGRGMYSGAPYMLSNGMQLGFGSSTTSSTTILPLEDVVLFPGQVMEFRVADPVTAALAQGVELPLWTGRKSSRTAIFSISSSSNEDENYVDNGIKALNELFNLLSAKPYVFTIVYHTIDSAAHGSARSVWNVDELKITRNTWRLN
jgi:hypothetical protein